MSWPVLVSMQAFYESYSRQLLYMSTKAVELLIEEGLIFLALGFRFTEYIVSNLNILHHKPDHVLSFIYGDHHINFSMASGIAGRTRH